MPVRDLIRAISQRSTRRGNRGRRRPDVSRLHHRRPAGPRSRHREGRLAPQRQLDLYSGTRRGVGRLQIFNNWSPWLVSNLDKVWIGLEYFCNETDHLWKLSDEEMAKLRHRGSRQDRHSQGRGCGGFPRGPRPQNLSCLLRQLWPLRRDPQLHSTASKTSS